MDKYIIRPNMTEKLVKEYSITKEVLSNMFPGTYLGPFNEGYMVDPNLIEGSPNSGYPKAKLTIKRHGVANNPTEEKYTPYGTWGIIVEVGKSQIGPKAGGQKVGEVMTELLSRDHSFPGEIENKSSK